MRGVTIGHLILIEDGSLAMLSVVKDLIQLSVKEWVLVKSRHAYMVKI